MPAPSPPANTGPSVPTPLLGRKARPTSKECPWGLGRERHVHRYMRSSRRQGSGPGSPTCGIQHTHSTREGRHRTPHRPLWADPHTLNGSGNDSAAFHITMTRRLDCVATHSQGTGGLHMMTRHVRGRRQLGGKEGGVHHSGREDTGLGNLETHEQQRGQDPMRSRDHGEHSAKLRSFEAGHTEIVSRSSYSGLGQSSSRDLLEGWRRGAWSPGRSVQSAGQVPRLEGGGGHSAATLRRQLRQPSRRRWSQ